MLKNIAEYFIPVLSSSHFYEKGVLTPEEFVLAGDQLVFRCPTWEWAAGESSRTKDYLPADKQFLITRNVPSLLRAQDYEMQNAEEAEVELDDDDGGWTYTHRDMKDGQEDIPEIGDIDEQKDIGAQFTTPLVIQQHSSMKGLGLNEDIPDMAEFEEDNLMVQDDSTIPSTQMMRAVEPEASIIHTRTYDISITYDKYYQVPRVFLSGFDKHARPLTTENIMEDISAEHANKTVTVETHPHLGIPHASIHPCKHSEVVRKLVGMMMEKSGKKFAVDLYLILFLKFIASVIPTIQYDYTMSVDL